MKLAFPCLAKQKKSTENTESNSAHSYNALDLQRLEFYISLSTRQKSHGEVREAEDLEKWPQFPFDIAAFRETF